LRCIREVEAMPADNEPNGYLQEWAVARGKRQADLVNELGWVKNAAHRIWHGKQPYRRDILNACARWLDIEPYELLLHPQEADSLRRIRLAAQLVVAERAPRTYRHREVEKDARPPAPVEC